LSGSSVIIDGHGSVYLEFFNSSDLKAIFATHDKLAFCRFMYFFLLITKGKLFPTSFAEVLCFLLFRKKELEREARQNKGYQTSHSSDIEFIKDIRPGKPNSNSNNNV
jgi:hypothetical protein